MHAVHFDHWYIASMGNVVVYIHSRSRANPKSATFKVKVAKLSTCNLV